MEQNNNEYFGHSIIRSKNKKSSTEWGGKNKTLY